MRRQTLYFYVLLSGVLALASCAEKDDKNDDTASDSTSTGTGTGSQPDQDTNLASTATVNIGTVHDNMLPGSLAIDTGAELLLMDDNENPCADTTGFFDCQTNLLKLYMDLAKQMVGQTNEIVAELSTGLFSHIAPPTDGIEVCDAVQGDDESGTDEVEYCVTSETKFSFLIKSESGPFLYLDVDGTHYEIKGDMANSPDEEGETGQIHATIDYTSATDFEVDVRLLNMGCRDEDVRAPNTIGIKVTRNEGVWQGKAMLYAGRWLFAEDDGVTCNTEPTDDLAVTIYTDFVGNDDKSTAALYVMPRTVTATADISNYPASAFCDNFPGGCNNGYGFGDPNPIASYENDFCVNADETTWGAACEDDNELIATPTFLPMSDFITPSDISTLALDMPEEL